MLRTLSKHLFGIALTWVVVLVGTFFLLRWYSQPSAEREVLSLEGMAKKEAQDALEALELEAVWQDSIYSSTGEPGALWWNSTLLRAVR